MGVFNVGTDGQDWILRQAKEGISAKSMSDMRTSGAMRGKITDPPVDKSVEAILKGERDLSEMRRLRIIELEKQINEQSPKADKEDQRGPQESTEGSAN